MIDNFRMEIALNRKHWRLFYCIKNALNYIITFSQLLRRLSYHFDKPHLLQNCVEI